MSLHIIYGILYDSYFTILSFAKFFLKKWKFGDLCELKSELKMSELLQQKWATFTHVHELKLGGKYEPIMSHVREWTSERGVHVHVCTSLVIGWIPTMDTVMAHLNINITIMQ